MKMRVWLERKLHLEEMRNETHKDVMFRFGLITFFFIVIGLFIIVRTAMIIILEHPTPQMPKNIKKDFARAINKGCFYEDLKNIFDNKERVDNSLYNGMIDVYEPNVDIIFVINDMIHDYYKTPSVDTAYVAKLYFFRSEAKQKSPFDKLDSSQKELFERLRLDAGDSYYLIENDVMAISNELFDKNSDINEYLDKSNQSYILSIIAFFVSLFPFIPPLWRYYKKNIGKLDK